MTETSKDHLNRIALFEIICDAAYRDGVIEGPEQKFIDEMASRLKLPQEKATEIVISACQKYEAGELGTPGRIDGWKVYEEALRVACAEGNIYKDERKLLDLLRKLFKIPASFHKEVVEKITKGEEPEEEPGTLGKLFASLKDLF